MELCVEFLIDGMKECETIIVWPKQYILALVLSNWVIKDFGGVGVHMVKRLVTFPCSRVYSTMKRVFIRSEMEWTIFLFNFP